MTHVIKRYNYKHASLSLSLSFSLYVCIYIYIHVDIYIYKHIYIYIYDVTCSVLPLAGGDDAEVEVDGLLLVDEHRLDGGGPVCYSLCYLCGSCLFAVSLCVLCVLCLFEAYVLLCHVSADIGLMVAVLFSLSPLCYCSYMFSYSCIIC